MLSSGMSATCLCTWGLKCELVNVTSVKLTILPEKHSNRKERIYSFYLPIVLRCGCAYAGCHSTDWAVRQSSLWASNRTLPGRAESVIGNFVCQLSTSVSGMTRKLYYHESSISWFLFCVLGITTRAAPKHVHINQVSESAKNVF